MFFALAAFATASTLPAATTTGNLEILFQSSLSPVFLFSER